MKIFVLGVLGILLLGILGFAMSPNKTPAEKINQPEAQEQSTAPNELQIEDIVVGEGKEAVSGALLAVHYKGTLLDGTRFDSSLDRGEPFQFVLGKGSVIQGWEQAVPGMKVGGKRRIVIPPNLAYGAAQGHPLQKETLVFEIELLDVKEP